MILDEFHIFLYFMFIVAIAVFVALFFVRAGYGIFQNNRWGVGINNRIGWVLMECPVFVAMFLFLFLSPNEVNLTRIVIFGLFQMHYLQRAFIFPLLIKGNSQMPLSVMFMGIFFNLLNAVMQGYWLFFESYKISGNLYLNSWLSSSWFVAGTILFLFGFVVNLHSDYTIRHLRKSPTDTKHYLPKGGMFNFVTSANYFGEVVEWFGFAMICCSLSGLAFFVWTFANLVPRAYSIHKKYGEKFSDEIRNRNLKAIFPFVF